ncbi:MAG TPA: hypothetical protein VEO53_13320 [Candidatus Binatia bacterium]|nr:hypothetical protein [Candidatus Binatia bacterium]
MPEVGASGPLNADPLPRALREFHLNGVSVSPEGGEDGITEAGREGCGLFSEQAEVKKLIDIDDTAGQPELFDQDAFFAFLFYTGPGFHHRP